MADQVECEIGLAIDDAGEWVVCKWEDEATQLFMDNVGLGGDGALRVIKLKLMVTPARAQEAIITVPDEAGETITATAE